MALRTFYRGFMPVEEKDKWTPLPEEEIDGPLSNTGRSPLNIKSKCIYTADQLIKQIQENSKRKLPEFMESIVQNNGDFTMVGSGPSVENCLEQIKDRQDYGMPIVAIKGAHDWMIERGIIPDLCVMLDPQPKIKNCIKLRGQWPATHRGCKYLIASQCAPEIFDLLKHQRVYIWNALSNIGEKSILSNETLLVGGGTTTGLRAMNLGFLMGFRRFRMFGFDSCLKDKESKIKRVNGDTATKVMDIECGDHVFYANPAMAAQANEIQSMIKMFAGSIRLKSYGYGLITELLRERRRQRMNDWFVPDMELESDGDMPTSTNDIYPESAVKAERA
tara:strand:+ start:5114 stop:6112 length:999 start_codon:yes stop_codon:yes gene_type:complete